jgi:hypothetical protein
MMLSIFQFLLLSNLMFVSSMLLLTTIGVDGFLLPVTENNNHRHRYRDYSQRYKTTSLYGHWLGDLWNEVIEFSTYGPAERRMLKAKREAAEAQAAPKSDDNDISLSSFQQAKRQMTDKTTSSTGITSSSTSGTTTAMNNKDGSTSSLSLEAFQAAVASTSKETTDDDLEFDGYALRDLLVTKWGVPLDIDFQRGYSGSTVYCTVLPAVGFGTFKARHASEMNYLMHLQAVVEILHQYNNLDAFIMFIQSTQRVPKPGVESVPFRLDLNGQELQKILGTTVS